MARSTQAITVGRVRSQVAITTRNLDHASHAQNRFVLRPEMTGPAPQSHCAHMPGSGIHGRYTRRRPRRWLAFTSATVRSEPLGPAGWGVGDRRRVEMVMRCCLAPLFRAEAAVGDQQPHKKQQEARRGSHDKPVSLGTNKTCSDLRERGSVSGLIRIRPGSFSTIAMRETTPGIQPKNLL